jgi:uncharacterized membrane protein YozB (DUF420 family)
MTHELSDLLNRIGMALGFLSFWLVAPEFIGEERLRSWEQALATGLLKAPKALKWSLAVMTLAAVVVYVVRSLSTWPPIRFPDVPQWWVLVLALTSATMLTAEVLITPIVSRLANDNRVRQSALLLGAALFTISFLLQFIATFQTGPAR